jgi:hypothetical protein
LINTNNFSAPADIDRLRNIALGIGGICALVVLSVAALFPEWREQALRSWLLGYVFWCGIGIGSLGLLILQYLTGGAWGVVIRRIVEAGSRTLPILAVMFVPLFLGVRSIYEWAYAPGSDEILAHRLPYLNPTAWGIRAIIYFAILGLIAHFLNKWSLEQDGTTNYESSASLLGKSTKLCGPIMPVFAIVVTFASIDWVMTLDPHWYSTIWGLLFLVGWGLSCLAFVIALLAWLSDLPPMNRIVGSRHFHDLGKLMLALVMVWAYFNFSQLLIIWSGNLPEETPWYLKRMSGAWGVIGVVLILFHFAFPFLVLLSRDVKRNAKWLSLMAIFILMMRLVDLFYLIAPSPYVGKSGDVNFHLSVLDFLAPVAVGGLWLWWFLGELRKRPLVPVNDPFLDNAIAHGKAH